MRPLIAGLLATLLVGSCSKPAPPVGRWEGAYESGSTFIVARLELAPNAQARISAPDVTDPGTESKSDRAAMRQNMADRLAGAWGDVDWRPMDFDGAIFRKPGGFAPQFEWDQASNVMTLYVYLGTRPAIGMRLRPVRDFNSNPWVH